MWQGGRVVSEYVGAGPRAELFARVDAEYRKVRAAERAEWKAEKQALDGEDLARAAAFDAVGLIVRLALESAGFHKHHRGGWRRMRMGKSKTAGLPSLAECPALIAGAIARDKAALAAIRGVIEKAKGGDMDALRRLKELIRLDPERMIRSSGGDLDWQYRSLTIERLTGENNAWHMSIDMKMEAIRGELSGPDPTPIEKLLVERVVSCWLDLQDREVRHATRKEMSIRQAEHAERLRDRSHRRYLQALRSLAAVRKLDLVAIQVNINGRPPDVPAP